MADGGQDVGYWGAVAGFEGWEWQGYTRLCYISIKVSNADEAQFRCERANVGFGKLAIHFGNPGSELLSV